MKNRSYGYDNLRFILIFCVVMAHFLEIFGDKSLLEAKETLYFVIYCFHMPVFFFLAVILLSLHGNAWRSMYFFMLSFKRCTGCLFIMYWDMPWYCSTIHPTGCCGICLLWSITSFCCPFWSVYQRNGGCRSSLWALLCLCWQAMSEPLAIHILCPERSYFFLILS